MRRFTLIVAGLLSIGACAGTAPAADLPDSSPAAIAAPVQFSWTGCYLGGHLGGVATEDTDTSISGTSRQLSSTGFAGGAQIGCDRQSTLGWVAGVEGRAAWSSLRDNNSGSVRNLVTGIIVPSQLTLRNDFLASATARIGYSFAGHGLVFVRGGGAWTHEKIDDAFISSVFGIPVDPNASMTRTGWTTGVGVEWALTQHWSTSVEYNYYDFGSRSVTLTNSANDASVIMGGVKDTIHELTAGLNYRF
jgi:outer membrane immunogenic protein